MAIFAALVGFCNVVVGFRNADVVERVGALLDEIPYSCRQATYDLRRLKRKGLIVKMRRSHRYQLTDLGRRVAVDEWKHTSIQTTERYLGCKQKLRGAAKNTIEIESSEAS